MMNIYEAIKKDHEVVLGLLTELVNLEPKDEARRSSLVQEIRDELIPHSRAEEAVLYNLIRAQDGAKGVVAHGYQEHIMAEMLLRTLQVAESIDAGWKETAQKLKTALEHHIKEEETEIFDAAQKLFTEEEAEMMADTFETMKPRIKDESMMGTTRDLLVNMLPPNIADKLNVSTVRN